MRRVFNRAVTTTVFLIGSVGVADADIEFPSGNGPLIPAIHIGNAVSYEFVDALITTFQIMAKQDIPFFTNDGDIEKVNFFYSSGSGFLTENKVSSEAVPFFSEEMQGEILGLNTNSEVCYVQDFRLSSGRKFVLTIHNENNDFIEDIYRCLSAGLWQYKYGDLEGFEGNNWRQSFSSLVKFEE